MLTIRNVSKKYDKNQYAIHNCNLELTENKILGILGENGSGKTTLLKMIAGIYQSDHGTIRLNEEIIFENELIKQQVVLISDQNYFPSRATLKTMKNLYQIFYPNFNEATYLNLKTMLNIDENQNIHSFSKGVKQQVALILGLSIDAKLILLDEALDGLDLKVRYDIKKYISKLVEEKNISMIIASHHLQELELLCDEIAVIQTGNVQKYDQIEKLVTKIYKVNVIYKEKVEMALQQLYHENNGKIQTFIIQADEHIIRNYLEQLDVVFYEILPCSLEEVFVYTMKGEV